MQYLEAKIPIPEGYVIISQVDYEELKKADDTGRWMTLPEVLERINRTQDIEILSISRKTKMDLSIIQLKEETHIYF